MAVGKIGLPVSSQVKIMNDKTANSVIKYLMS